jgi:hypothetical protein
MMVSYIMVARAIASANDVLSRVFNNIGADEPGVHIQH